MVATNPKQWKKAISGVELSLPSGNTCLARRVELRRLLNAGVIPNSLMDIVKEALKGKKLAADTMADDIDLDPAKLNDMLAFMDQVVIDCVLNPKVRPIPYRATGAGNGEKVVVPFEERDEEQLYIDEVDELDKQFVFNFAVGGTSDVERFRGEQEEQLASVHAGTSLEGSPESVDEDR